MRGEQEQQKILLEQVHNRTLPVQRFEGDLAKNTFELVELKGRIQYFRLREKWAYLLGGINIAVVVCVFLMLFLSGLVSDVSGEYIMGIDRDGSFG